MGISRKYNKSLEQKWCMRFKTVHPDGDKFDGVVTLNRRSFVVLQDNIDFEFNGLVIIPKRMINGYRDGRFEGCMNKIIRENRQIEKVCCPEWLRECKSIRDVIFGMKTKEIWPAVETLYDLDYEIESAFHIGPITEIGKHEFTILCYDATGGWESEYIVEFSEVFKIVFGDKYSKYFNSYMRAHNTASN